jgi:hypothetical protein
MPRKHRKPRSVGKAVRRFIRIVVVGCLIVAAAAAVLVGSLWAWTSYRSAQIEAYYREVPLLNRMPDREKQSSNDSEAACEVLLDPVPLGSGREDTFAVLHEQERFSCQPRVESEADRQLAGFSIQPQDHPAAKDLVECMSGAPSIVAYTSWIVRLEFADGRPSSARVAVWHSFL